MAAINAKSKGRAGYYRHVWIRIHMMTPHPFISAFYFVCAWLHSHTVLSFVIVKWWLEAHRPKSSGKEFSFTAELAKSQGSI